MVLTLHRVAQVTGGRLEGGRGDQPVASFAIDSRVLVPGACFVALRGTRDGHEFVDDAFAKGAVGAIVAHPPAGAIGSVVVVDDPLAALSALGRVARDELGRAAVVAVTGSAGKTATKDLVSAALATRLAVHASPSSFNNEAGLPLTLLGASPGSEAVVVEMGARVAGNITDLCRLARPTVGVITHVGLAHAEPLGGPDGIAAVKGELVEALPAGGLAILNADDPWTPSLASRTDAEVRLAGHGADPASGVRIAAVDLDAELRPLLRLETPAGVTEVRLTLRGAHQAHNAAMALAVALHLGVGLEEAARGLAGARSAAWRMELERSPSGIMVLNDSYNASPTSTAAALSALARLPVTGRRVAVLGEMRELGTTSEQAHASAGSHAAELGIDVVVAVGAGARPVAHAARRAGVSDATTVEDPGAAIELLRSLLEPGDAVLVKASRAVGLEQIADALVRDDGPVGDPA